MSDKSLLMIQEHLYKNYENKEFTLSTGQTNYDYLDNVTGAFATIPGYTTVNIRSDQAITVRINSTDNDYITIEANKTFELDNLLFITNIYITNASGSTANIKILGINKNNRDA